jgi:hypothetical protein
LGKICNLVTILMVVDPVFGKKLFEKLDGDMSIH